MRNPTRNNGITGIIDLMADDGTSTLVAVNGSFLMLEGGMEGVARKRTGYGSGGDGSSASDSATDRVMQPEARSEREA